MKLLLLTFLVAAAAAIPIPDEGPVEVIVNGVPEGQPLDIEDLLDVKVNEHVNGALVSATNALYPFSSQAIEAAIAAQKPELEAVAEVDIPEQIVLPAPAVPEAIESAPSPVLLPEAALPESPESVVLPEASAPVVLPQAPAPEVVETPLEVAETPVVVAETPVVVAETPEVVAETPEAVVLPEAAIPEIADLTPNSPEAEDGLNVIDNLAEDVNAESGVLPTGEIFNDGTVQVSVNAPEGGILATVQSWLDMAINYVSNGVQTSQQII